MKEHERDQGHIKVNDRRRFDSDGTPRGTSEADAGTPAANNGPGPSKQPSTATPSSSTDSEQVLQLQRELEAARKRIDELARGLQALDRDREDFKERLTRERERLLEIEKANIALILLDVMDELDLSIQASGDEDSPTTRGVKLIREGLLNKIQSLGIERVDVMNRPFDPKLAEAADTELTSKPEDDQKIVAVVRPGYRLKDRIIRPARVRVARYLTHAQA